MSTTFKYDVAISFAGEQRRDAEAIADHLRAAGLTVFYDTYEQVDLWGKNLADHLADVYQHHARYCLMLVSKEYAAKVWTTHERQSAQARAITQNTEYILPVRFDDTPIPGLLPTIGYVQFKDHGAQGIATLLLQKLGKATPPNAAPASIITSPRTCIIDQQSNLRAWIPTTKCTWGNTEATVVLQPDDPTDGPFLDGLRSSRHRLLIAFKHNIGLFTVREVRNEFTAGNDQWTLQLRIEESDFTPTMEMSAGGLSADQIAAQRARRILLNENPSRNTTDPNQIVQEIMLRGFQTPQQVQASPFPALYQQFSKDEKKFLESAWITGAMTLKTTGVIAEITTLALALVGTKLHVEFTGKRRRVYTNQDPATITISGHCTLT